MICIRCVAAMVVSFVVSAAAFGQQGNAPEAESNVSGRGHIRVGCTTCHSVHGAKGTKGLFAVEPNTKVINPTTKKPFEGVSAICLGCHSEPEQGGMGMVPVSTAHSHPMGREFNPKAASVNVEFLRDGKLECVGCHDPHTSNPNWALLRVDTEQGKNMDVFCAMCHATKADPGSLEAIKKVQLFSSMDETKPPKARGSAPAAAPGAPAATPGAPAAAPDAPAATPAAPAATPGTPAAPPAKSPPKKTG
ncbi:MAG: cytochrome c3 family protein [Pirellulales bacterium]